ncbi:MAG: helix-turn-helix domain-containing protein [bacterium]
MAKRLKSPRRDSRPISSLISDTTVTLTDVLRDARLKRHLSQQELASKLGVRQRQISDLERAMIDPRLSTIQNVGRALDLELMLIPRHLISAVEGLQRAGSDSAKRPMYALSDDDVESGA